MPKSLLKNTKELSSRAERGICSLSLRIASSAVAFALWDASERYC